jgi:hypothetical protein
MTATAQFKCDWCTRVEDDDMVPREWASVHVITNDGNKTTLHACPACFALGRPGKAEK